MANLMHQRWTGVKDYIKKEHVDKVKKEGGMNPKEVEDALKSFDQGFGPLLEKAGTAYKNGKEAEAKKQATAALTVAERYLAKTKEISYNRGGSAVSALESLIRQLSEVKDKGLAARNYFYL